MCGVVPPGQGGSADECLTRPTASLQAGLSHDMPWALGFDYSGSSSHVPGIRTEIAACVPFRVPRAVRVEVVFEFDRHVCAVIPNPKTKAAVELSV